VLSSLIFTQYSAVPIAHIAPAVVAAFVEAIDAGLSYRVRMFWRSSARQSLQSLIGF
jgi:hypothetical protein